MNIIARILGNYIHYESDWSVENYEWQCLLDLLLAVSAAPLATSSGEGGSAARLVHASLAADRFVVRFLLG